MYTSRARYRRYITSHKEANTIPEDQWPSEHYWKRRYPRLFPDSSSELEDKQQQVGHQFLLKKEKIYYFTSVYLFYSIIKQEANTDILARTRMFCFTHLFCQLSLRNNWHCLQSIIAVWIHFEIIWGHLPILWPPLWACVLLEYITNDVQYKWRPESLFNWYRFKDVYLLGWLKTEFKRRRNRSLFCV